MTSNDDPFLARPGDAGMRPVEPSPQPQPGAPLQPSWDPEPTSAVYGSTPVQPPAAVEPQAPPAPVYGAPRQPQPGYTQYPQGYQQGFNAGPRPTKTWMNIVSLVTALVGISLAAVILGHLGVRAANRGDADYKGLGIAGLILGYIGLVGGAIYLILIIVFVASTSTTTFTG